MQILTKLEILVSIIGIRKFVYLSIRHNNVKMDFNSCNVIHLGIFHPWGGYPGWVTEFTMKNPMKSFSPHILHTGKPTVKMTVLRNKEEGGGWTYYDPLVFSNLPTYSEGLKFHAKRWKMPRWVTLQELKSTISLFSVSSKQCTNAIHRIVFCIFFLTH